VVSFGGVFILEMRRHAGFFHTRRIGSRAVQECASRSPGPIDYLFVEKLVVPAVVVILLAHNVDQACPPAPNSDYLIAFAHGPYGDGAYCRIQPRHIAPAGQNSNHPFARVNTRHESRSASVAECWSVSAKVIVDSAQRSKRTALFALFADFLCAFRGKRLCAPRCPLWLSLLRELHLHIRSFLQMNAVYESHLGSTQSHDYRRRPRPLTEEP